MRVLQDDASAAVVVPYEEANGSGESFPAPGEASGASLQSAQVSTQVCIQALYRECLLLLLRNNMTAALRPQQLLIHCQSIRAVAKCKGKFLYELLHRYPTSFLHHAATYNQSSISRYRHHDVGLLLFLPTYVNSSSTSTVSVGVWSSTFSGRVS